MLANIDEGLIGTLVTKVQAETFENSLDQAEAYRISVTITFRSTSRMRCGEGGPGRVSTTLGAMRLQFCQETCRGLFDPCEAML